MSAGGTEEITCLMKHAILGKPVLIDFEVAWFQYACIFLHLFEVGVHATLPRFVGDDRNVDGRLFAAIPVGRGFAFVDGDPAFVLFSDIGSHVGSIILVRLHMRASRRGGIETAVVVGLPFLHEVFEDSKVAFVLIAIAKEDEGRVVAIFIENSIHLLLEEIAAGGVLPDILDPHRKFDLQVKSQFVCRIESSLRRTPGMKADMVHTVVFHCMKDAFPLLHIRSRIAGERKDATVQDTAQVDVATVHTDMVPALFHAAHTEDGRTYILACLRRKCSGQAI